MIGVADFLVGGDRFNYRGGIFNRVHGGHDQRAHPTFAPSVVIGVADFLVAGDRFNYREAGLIGCMVGMNSEPTLREFHFAFVDYQ